MKGHHDHPFHRHVGKHDHTHKTDNADQEESSSIFHRPVSRRDFLNSVKIGALSMVLMETAMLLPACSDSAHIEPVLGSGNAYKRLFNALNYQMAHFPPPEDPNEETLFSNFSNLFQQMLNTSKNDYLLRQALGDSVYEEFQLIIDKEPMPSEDILAMVYSTVTTKGQPPTPPPYEPKISIASETIRNSWDQFTEWYDPEMYGSLSISDFAFIIKTVLHEKFHLLTLVEEDPIDPMNSLYKCAPVIFGMGDEDWEKFIISVAALLVSGDEEREKYATGIYNLAENYMFGNTNAIKLYRAWDPALYRCVPVQLDSAEDLSGYGGKIENDPEVQGEPLWADGFSAWVRPMLWPWDDLIISFKNNQLKNANWGKCGCMADQATITNGKFRERAGHFLEMTKHPHSQEPTLDDYFTFDTSLRQDPLSPEEKKRKWTNVLTPDDEDLGAEFKENLQVAEDYNLMHMVFNFKGIDKTRPYDYLTWICNCHRNWCLQIRPQNLYFNEVPEGENIKVKSVEKAFYEVNLKNNCGECRDCYNKEGPAPDKITFICPVHAFDDAEETGKIASDRCLRCFLCVRHCYRKYPDERVAASNDGSSWSAETRGLKVSRVLYEEDLPRKVPENRWDRDQQRIAAVYNTDSDKEMHWPHFRYSVGAE